MIVLKRLSLLLLLLVFLLLAALAFVTMTHGGMKLIFSLGQSYVQGELSWSESTGTLMGPATLDDVVFVADSGVTVNIDKARIDWMPDKLLSRILQIDAFELTGVTINLAASAETSEKSTEPFELRDLALPFGVNLEHLNIEDIKLYPHGAEQPIEIDFIKLSAGGRDDAFKLLELSINAPQGELTMGGSINTSGDWPIDLKQQWHVVHPRYGEFSGSGTMLGDTRALRVQHALGGAAEVVIDAMVNDVTAELSWDGSVALQSDDLGVFSAAMQQMPLSVDATSSGSLQQYRANGAVKSSHSLSGPLQADFSVSGSLDELLLDRVAVALDHSQASAIVTGKLRYADLHSDLTVDWSDLPWPLIDEKNMTAADGSIDTSQSADTLVLSPTGRLIISGTPDDYNVKAEATVEQAAAGALEVALHIDGDPQLIRINSLAVDSITADTQLDVKGFVDLQQSLLEINGQWLELVWPLAVQPQDGTPLFNSKTGQFSVVGPLDNYKVVAELSVDGSNLPAGQWQLDANGDTASLKNINLKGQTLDGVVTASADVLWSPTSQWDFDLAADGINPAVKWPGADGDIAAVLRGQGYVSANGPQASVKIMQLSGDYQKQPVTGSGELQLADGVVTIDQLNLQAGIASLDANGALGETLALDWRLNAPALNEILPGMQGDIDIKGQLAGTAQKPSSDLSVEVTDFVVGDITIKSISGTGSIDLSARAQSEIQLDVVDISVAGQVWERLELSGSGVPEKHKVSVTLEGAPANLVATVDGALKGETWQGIVEQVDILETVVGDWSLEEPVAIKANPRAVEAGLLCLISDPSSLCIDGQWSSARGATAEIEIKQLNGARFGEFLPPDLVLDANLSGTATVTSDAAGRPDVIADFIIPGGNVNYLDNGEPVSGELGQSQIHFELRNDNVKSAIDLDLGPIGTANVDATIGGLSTTKKLSGTVKTDIEDMSIVSMFAPDLQALDGRFDTDVRLGGTLDQPQVFGETALNGLVTEIPAIAMKVLDGTMKVESDGSGGLNIVGSATSGDGRVDITGVVSPSSGDLDLVIKGEQFEVANTTRQRAVVSPDLKVKVSGEQIFISGDVHIPSAYIQTGGESGLIEESSDVVIVNEDGDVTNDQSESQLTVDVKVTLGDDIRVKAGEFNGSLAGGLTVRQQPGRVPTGSGTIEVVSGDFLVYGQALTMESGRILFGGGPIDNPAIDLDVARDVIAHDVKAGARVTGTAKAPLLQLQSEPAQTDANTLSYILFGEPVGTVGASYTMGKFITPELYISYGIGLFDQMNTFNLRYKISDKLALIGANSNDVSGADLIYTIER